MHIQSGASGGKEANTAPKATAFALLQARSALLAAAQLNLVFQHGGLGSTD